MIRFLEELSMSGWPSLRTHLYDGWVLRVSNGYTKRANSVNLLYQSMIDLEQKIIYCKAFYERLGLPVIYKVTSDPDVRVIDEKLNNLGYKKIGETSVRILDLNEISTHVNSDSRIFYQLTNEWVDGYIRSCRIEDNNNKESLKLMLKGILGKTIFVVQYVEDKAVGYGYGVIDNGYVGIFDIHVEEPFRGRGYGKAVMNSLLYESKVLGANTAYLQVVVGNKVAENLYRNLGFIEKYRYWYRIEDI